MLTNARAALFSLLVAFLLVSCAKQVPAQRAGAFNAFDSQTYDTLNVIQASIEQAKVDLPSFPTAKSILNKVIASYNLAKASYLTYHTALANGTLVDRVGLESQLSTLTVDFAALKEAMKK